MAAFNLNLKLPPQLAAGLGKFKWLFKHHYFMYMILLTAGLIWVVFAVNETLGRPSDQDYRDKKQSELLKARFDQTTIKKIEALQKSADGATPPPAVPPGVRTNPFAE